MVTKERLEARREAVAATPDLRALLAHLTEHAAPLVERLPPIPEHKALLSADGGVCPVDGAPLAFDPWSPTAHRCPACGQDYGGERHDRHWAKLQHLWLAERAAHLAGVAALGGGGHQWAAARARDILTAYATRYWSYPNRDNVLGPSRLFFSTYLESLWILSYLAGATILRAAGLLDDATAKGVTQVADEAANLIGEYDEGFSNRQTWNDAALAAIAVWFDDRELLERAAEGPTGLVAHLMQGFRRDGMWYEGENYHLFALRGVLTGLGWCRAAGLDAVAEPALAERLAAALRAPALTALPDFTFPARKDSRFGVSLAQPMYLECWEVGSAWLGAGDGGRGTGDLNNWLAALYRSQGPVPELFESYLLDAPIAPVPRPPSRLTLSWWALFEMSPEFSGDASAWRPESVLLDDQGLAVLRAGDRYASLECGPRGGGHGHADRLHLTLHAGGVHWLPDFGTGSYVARDLFWYRSTLAHNAPRLDGVSQVRADARCETFDVQGDWAWARGRWGGGDVTRTVVAGPHYLIDVVELAGREPHVLEVPWHFAGAGEVVTPGRWTAGDLVDEFVSGVER
ncbi:MAG: heparinase II/III domain-containing protein, partial [Gemmatimonadales bacterium]